MEYCWGYGKIRFRRDFNDAVAKNLKENVVKSLERDVIATDRVRKFTQKDKRIQTYLLTISASCGWKGD